MSTIDQLSEALRKVWPGLALRVDDSLRIVREGEVFGRLEGRPEEGRLWLPLLGEDLGIEFRDRAPWRAELAGSLLDMEMLKRVPAPVLEEGELRLTLPAGALTALGGRFRVSWQGEAAAAAQVAVSGAGARLVLGASAGTVLDLRLDVIGVLQDSGIQFALPIVKQGFLVGAKITVAAGMEPVVLVEVAAPADGGRAAARLVAQAIRAVVGDVPLEFAGRASLAQLPAGLLDSLVAGQVPLGNAVFAGKPTLALEDGRLQIRGVEIHFEGQDGLRLGNGVIDVGLDLRADANRPFATLEVLNPHFALFPGEGSPFTCILRKGAQARLFLSTSGWRVDLRRSGGPAATVLVPGVSREAAATVPPDRFVLDVVAAEESEPPLSLGSRGGLSIRAVARDRAIEVEGLTDARVTGGTLQVRGSDWQLALQAEANLPWFRGARGRIGVQGGRSPGGDGFRFGASFEMSVGEGWTDPSGVLTVRNPTVSATLEWKRPGWRLGGSVGGSLVFNRVPFAGDAESWLGEVFSGASVEFDRVDLQRLKEILTEGEIVLRLKRPLRVSVWGVFRFELTAIGIGATPTITLFGDVGFSFGELRFRGQLPGLGVSLRGREIALDPGRLPSFRGFLTAPSGVRVAMHFTREQGEGVELLHGQGSITAPTIPDVEAMIRVGRFQTEAGWRPMLAINANAPVNTPVFPGVVLKRVGLGFGIHQTLRGLNVESVRDAFELLGSGSLPQPGESESWELNRGVEFSLVAQAIFAATTAAPSVPDYYVADLVLSLDTQLRLAGFGLLWMFTSVDDARTREFRQHPFSRGMMVIDAAEPSVVAAYESVPNPRMSVERALGPAGAVLGPVLGAVRTRASLEARPGLFDLTLGPNTLAFSLGPLRVKGSTLLGVRASAAGAFAVAAVDLSAQVSASMGLRIGMATLGIEAAAGFGLAATLFGGITGSNQLLLAADVRASAYARLVVSVEIRFVIRIRVGWAKIKITFSERWSFRFELELSVGATLAVGSSGAAFHGVAVVKFKVLGISVQGDLPVAAGSSDLLNEARQAMHRARQGGLPSKVPS